MKDLEATIELMLSDDPIDNLKAEYYQTKIRYQQLSSMLMKFDTGKLDFIPTCPVGILAQQAYAMGEYLQMLERRAEAEQVNL